MFLHTCIPLLLFTSHHFPSFRCLHSPNVCGHTREVGSTWHWSNLWRTEPLPLHQDGYMYLHLLLCVCIFVVCLCIFSVCLSKFTQKHLSRLFCQNVLSNSCTNTMFQPTIRPSSGVNYRIGSEAIYSLQGETRVLYILRQDVLYFMYSTLKHAITPQCCTVLYCILFSYILFL